MRSIDTTMRWTTVAILLLAVSPAFAADNWPQWRGPDQNGRSETARDLPLHWSPTENVKWRVELESWSAATPIVWGDTIFITSAEEGFNDPLKYGAAGARGGRPGGPRAGGRRPGGNARPESNMRDELFLLALNREDGSLRWKRRTGGENRIFRKHNMTSPSPVTDGEHVWVMTGVGLLTAFDFEGEQQWMRDLQADYGWFGLNWGYASSPKLHEGRLYVQVLHGMTTDDPSYVLALDAATGETIWRVERPTDAPNESPDNYATPILTPVEGKLQLIVSGGDYVTGHDIDSGEELWRIGGFNPDQSRSYRTIASSVAIDDVVYTTSRGGRPFVAFRPGGEGDITGKAEVWTNNLGSDVPTPTTDGKILYVVNDRGILTALDPKTGETVYERQRLEPGAYSASPLLADGRIYATSEDGATTVVKAGPEFEILAVNKLDDYTLGSPVAVDGQIFLRTMKYLYCLEEE